MTSISRSTARTGSKISCGLTRVATALRRAAAFMMGLQLRRARADDVIAAKYAGRAWCDETEHGLIKDISQDHR
jgi:hypothetical protein